MQSENTLLVDSVTLSFGAKQVLNGAYITARTGRVTGVLGRNGTGKSCLFKCIMGGIKPQNIFIRFNEERETDYHHIGNRIKYLPQQVFIPSSMTFGEAFDLYGVDYEGLIAFDTKFYSYRNRPLFELSGGAIRIAETYLILKTKAEFCILDEPFSNIAPKYVEKMQRLIDEQKATKGIIISDHLYESVMESTDDMFLLSDGYTFPIKDCEDLIRLGYLLR
jgi:ABC-type multidrug transport system ATPase subunit